MEKSGLEIRKEAALALDAGMRLAQRAAQMRRGLPVEGEMSGRELGAILADPVAFWAGASTSRLQGDEGTVESIVLSLRLASAKLAAGDLEFVRSSLLGQAVWLGLLAVKMAVPIEGSAKPEQAMQMVKLALHAQRQAAQCLASAAALGRLGVDVTDD